MLGLNKKLVLVLLLYAIVTLSCARGTKILNVSYKSDLPESAGLKGVQPLVFVVNKFEDDRPFIDRVTYTGNACGIAVSGRSGQKITTADVRNIIQNAISIELERHNHKVYPSLVTENTDIIINGTITEFWTEEAAFSKMVATIRASIVAKNARTSDILMSKEFIGMYNTEKVLILTRTFENLLNEAHKKFVNNLIADNDFIEACKKVSH